MKSSSFDWSLLDVSVLNNYKDNEIRSENIPSINNPSLV